jgi:diguanylate cyclase (GGDEF)-like protein
MGSLHLLRLEISFMVVGLVLILSYLIILLLFAISLRINMTMFDKAKKESNLNRILFELIQKSVMATNSDDLYQMILDSAIASIPSAQKGCIMLLNSKTDTLNFVAAKGYDFDILKNTFLRLDQTYLYRESQGEIRETVVIDDPFDYDRLNLHDDNIDTILEAGSDAVYTTLSTPVMLGDTLYGMINIDSKFRGAYDKDDQHIIELFAFEVINVIKLYQSLEKVNYFMHHDILTHSFNRHYFNMFLEKKLEEAELNKTTLTLVTMDLNNLKITNDTYGHECGDKLLMTFASGIKKGIRSTDCFARYGGDEFQLLLIDLGDQEVEALINRIQQYFEGHPLMFKDHRIFISFCYGIARYPEDDITFGGLISKADQCMYVQKKQFHLRQSIQ